MIIFPRTGGISERQKMLTDLPMGFFERKEAKPHMDNVEINAANISIKASLTIMPP
jgi:hypothetical protein